MGRMMPRDRVEWIGGLVATALLALCGVAAWLLVHTCKCA